MVAAPSCIQYPEVSVHVSLSVETPRQRHVCAVAQRPNANHSEGSRDSHKLCLYVHEGGARLQPKCDAPGRTAYAVTTESQSEINYQRGTVPDACKQLYDGYCTVRPNRHCMR
jgi:capsular polysaccharide biosynthesis protein